jgi:hypothetical protein
MLQLLLVGQGLAAAAAGVQKVLMHVEGGLAQEGPGRLHRVQRLLAGERQQQLEHLRLLLSATCSQKQANASRVCHHMLPMSRHHGDLLTRLQELLKLLVGTVLSAGKPWMASAALLGLLAAGTACQLNNRVSLKRGVQQALHHGLP